MRDKAQRKRVLAGGSLKAVAIDVFARLESKERARGRITAEYIASNYFYRIAV